MIITELNNLAKLSSDELAVKFIEANIRAPRDTALFNPVAQWLEQFAEQPIDYVAVTEEELYVITADATRFRFDLPPPIREFVARFNNGDYGELEGVPYNEQATERKEQEAPEALAQIRRG